MGKNNNEIVTPTVPEVKEPTEGSSETHLNAFLYDMEQAFKQAQAALADVELKYKALRSKLGV